MAALFPSPAAAHSPTVSYSSSPSTAADLTVGSTYSFEARCIHVGENIESFTLHWASPSGGSWTSFGGSASINNLTVVKNARVSGSFTVPSSAAGQSLRVRARCVIGSAHSKNSYRDYTVPAANTPPTVIIHTTTSTAVGGSFLDLSATGDDEEGSVRFSWTIEGTLCDLSTFVDPRVEDARIIFSRYSVPQTCVLVLTVTDQGG